MLMAIDNLLCGNVFRGLTRETFCSKMARSILMNVLKGEGNEKDCDYEARVVSGA